jgi:uncharacterized protein YdhG (YjbR/CyaY superfamily)
VRSGRLRPYIPHRFCAPEKLREISEGRVGAEILGFASQGTWSAAASARPLLEYRLSPYDVGAMGKFATIDDYVAALPDAVQAVASAVRATIGEAAPGAVEAVKYDMPAFQKDGASFVYFAVWKKHIGMYPIYRGNSEFENVIGPYRAKKDTVQFSLDKPLPIELITRIVHSQLAKLRQSKADKEA